MTCDEVRDLLLEVDPSMLRGTDDSPLAGHLAQCEACRALAARLTGGTADLRRGYEVLQPATPASEIITAAATAGVVLPITSRRRVWSLVGVGIAAGLGFIVLGGYRREAARPVPGNAAPPDSVSMHPVMSVEVPEGRNAAVMATSNPDITVILFY